MTKSLLVAFPIFVLTIAILVFSLRIDRVSIKVNKIDNISITMETRATNNN